MKKLALIAILLSLAFKAYAGQGFGSTYGTGAGDNVHFTYSPTSSMSMSTWMYFNATNTANVNNRIYDTGSATNTNGSLSYNPSTGKVAFAAGFSTTQGVWTATAPSAGAWHHLCITYNGASTSNVPAIYTDGSALSVTTSTGASGTVTTSSSTYFIGNNSTFVRVWDGVLSHIAFWNTILTANDCLGLAKGASPLKVNNAALKFYAPLYNTKAADWGSSHLGLTTSGITAKGDGPVQGYPLQWVGGQ